MSRLTFSLGKLLSPTEGDTYRNSCSCKRGHIEYDFYNGSWIPRCSVWDGGKSFGRLTFAPCCQQCQQDDEKEYQRGIARY